MSDAVGLKVPKVEAKAFKRNFIRNAVCEFRFPTLLELEEKPPIALQTHLRKDYPIYDRINATKFGAGAPENHERHLFKSRDKEWTIAFTPSSIAIETAAYRDFPSFAGRIRRMMDLSAEVIDSTFYTRVGLRYINAIPSGSRPNELADWINPDLVASLISETYGEINRYWNEVHGKCEGGRFTFRHGFQPTEPGAPPEYILDFDFYAEDVAVEHYRDLIASFNAQCFNFFHWAIGPKAIETLNG